MIGKQEERSPEKEDKKVSRQDNRSRSNSIARKQLQASHAWSEEMTRNQPSTLYARSDDDEKPGKSREINEEETLSESDRKSTENDSAIDDDEDDVEGKLDPSRSREKESKSQRKRLRSLKGEENL